MKKQHEKGFMVLEGLLKSEVNQENRDLIISQTQALSATNNQGTFGSYSDLLKLSNFALTIMQFILFYNSGFVFYGLIYVLPVVLKEYHMNLSSGEKQQNLKFTSSQMVTAEQYDTIISEIIISCIFECVSDISSSILPNISIIGRKGSIYIGFFITGIFAALCLIHIEYMPLYSCFMRLFINIPYVVVNIYCSEVYPTYMRTTAMGICSAISQLGAFTAPFICNFLLMRSPLLPFVGFMIFCFTGFFVGVALPFDTLNKPTY